ncbi:MAG: hypothetical protein ACI8RZ_001824 [Myxococcota bacterium]|jgi:hypothetical protein
MIAFLSLTAFAAEPAIPAAAEGLGKGMHIHLEQTIAAPADEVWRVLAHEYVGVDVWSSIVLASRPMTTADLSEGTTSDPDAPVIGRVVTSGFGDVTEALVMYDEADRTFTFRAGNLPGIIAYSQNTHEVHDLGDGTSTVTFDIYVVPKGVMRLMKGKLRSKLSEGLGHHLEEAAAYIETGALSEAKQAQLAAR